MQYVGHIVTMSLMDGKSDGATIVWLKSIGASKVLGVSFLLQ